MQGYKKVTVVWEKELKKSVPFIVKVNGAEAGIISGGNRMEFWVYEGRLNLMFCPKAPKWFGWKALAVSAVTAAEDEIFINIGVVYDANPFGPVAAAVNCKNQLHTKGVIGLVDYGEEHLKKW